MYSNFSITRLGEFSEREFSARFLFLDPPEIPSSTDPFTGSPSHHRRKTMTPTFSPRPVAQLPSHLLPGTLCHHRRRHSSRSHSRPITLLLLLLLSSDLVHDLVAQGTPVLHVEPLPQADAVEVVIALGDAGRLHLLVADGADVGELAQLPGTGLGQQVDLVDGVAALHEDAPAGLGLAPQVEVGVDAHHERADRAAGLEHQDPEAVEEEDYAEGELDRVAERPGRVGIERG